MIAPQALDAVRGMVADGRLDEANARINALLDEGSGDGALLTLAARVARRRHDLPAAAALMARATRAKPDDTRCRTAWAADLVRLGRIDEAESALSSIEGPARAAPGVQIQLARIDYQRHAFARATDTLVALVRAHPRFAPGYLELAQVLLMRGKWRAGWRAYESRYRLPGTKHLLPRLPSEPWNGRSINGPLVLIADQGYGDCFQFMRYIPLAATCCGTVTLMRSEPLAGLIDTVPGVGACHARWEDLPPHPAHCTLSGLPGLFDTRPETIPSGVGLLRVDSGAAARWRARVLSLAGDVRLRVGLAWSGRADYADNYLRSVPPDRLAPLTRVPKTRLFSLQYGAPPETAAALGLVDTTAEQTPFREAAALMQQLDLVITTDTAVAHLAGALRRPTWLMLAHAPDWRWGPSGVRSAWYPSLRLFRQDVSRRWEPVIAQVETALREVARSPDPVAALAALTPRGPVAPAAGPTPA